MNYLSDDWNKPAYAPLPASSAASDQVPAAFMLRMAAEALAIDDLTRSAVERGKAVGIGGNTHENRDLFCLAHTPCPKIHLNAFFLSRPGWPV